jgi:hypothetical protein
MTQNPTTTGGNDAIIDQAEDELCWCKNEEYLEEYGHDTRLVTTKSCTHRTHAEFTVSSSSSMTFQSSDGNLVDCTLLLYDCMIHSDVIHPNLVFLCIKCNDSCKSCGSSADWILDSGTLRHFTFDMSDFSSFKEIPEGNNFVSTAAVNRLLSMGMFLKKTNEVISDSEDIHIINQMGQTVLSCKPWFKHEATVYWAFTHIENPESLADVALAQTMHVADYQIWHNCLSHLNDQALMKMHQCTKKFLNKLQKHKNRPLVLVAWKGK